MKKIFVLIVCLTLLQGKIMATEGDPVEPIPLGVSLTDVDNAPINVGKGKAPIRIPRIYKDGYRLILGFHPEYIINIIQNGEVLYTSIIPEEQTDYDIFGDQISILNTREPEEPIDPGTDTSEPEEQDETEPNDSDHDGSSEEEPSSNDSDPQEPGSSDKDNKDPKENKPKTSTLDHKYTEATRKKNPLTGDRSNTGGYLFLLFLALVCLVLTFIKKKR